MINHPVLENLERLRIITSYIIPVVVLFVTVTPVVTPSIHDTR